jgi:hypothetical protein
MTKLGNYNIDYLHTYFKSEGYFDKYYEYSNLNEADVKVLAKHRRETIVEKDGKYIYEFIITPNDAFLNENQPLPPGAELQLSFDRLPAEFSVLKLEKEGDDTLKGKVLELKNVFAQVEYISSPMLRNFADQLMVAPITYKYDECTVLCKTLPKGEQQIRLENIRGGNTPDYVFIGLTDTTALNGSTKNASTCFKNHGVKEINITLNGNSCHGYPIQIRNDYPMWPYKQLAKVLSKSNNPTCSNQQTMDGFMMSCIFAHKFEGEDSNQGWIGVTFTLDEPFESNKSLGML